MSILLEAMPFIVLGADHRRAARRAGAAKVHHAHPAAQPLPGHRHRRPARPDLPHVRVRHHPRDAPPAAQGAAGQLLRRLPAGRADHQRRRHAQHLHGLRRQGRDAGAGGHGAADGRPVDDGHAHGHRLPRRHRDQPHRRLAVQEARQQAADAVGRAERADDGGRRRPGAAAVDRRTHHEHRADRPARFRGHHGVPDPRRPDRLADAAADLAGNGGQLVARATRTWPSAL